MKHHTNGSVELLGETIDYEYRCTESGLGTANHTLELDRDPFSNHELLELMRSIAPYKSEFAFTPQGMIDDLSMTLTRGRDFDPVLMRKHSEAFGDDWSKVMAQHAPLIEDNLKLFDVRLSYGHPKLRDAIAHIRNRGVRDDLFRRYHSNEELARPGAVTEDGQIFVSAAPFVIVADKEGNETYVNRYGIDIDDAGIAAQTTVRINNRQAVKAMQPKHSNHFPYPLWSTLHPALSGIVPKMSWQTEDGQKPKFIHYPPYEETVLRKGEEWRVTHSSVVGALVLANLNPDACAGWAARQPLREHGPVNVMGPLQATMLAVAGIGKILQSPRVQSLAG